MQKVSPCPVRHCPVSVDRRHRGPLPRVLAFASLMVGLVLAATSVAAAAVPTVSANPTQVPFSPIPGEPGVTILNFNANGVPGLRACGQDNTKTPTFLIGTVDPTTPLSVDFPFIQAGRYTFWVSTDVTCALGTKYGGTSAQVQVARFGPTGKLGADDLALRPTSGEIGIAYNQTFPLPGEQLCMMSGDGTQVGVNVAAGQDARLYGLGGTTNLTPFAGQNGCFDLLWVVNGGYAFSIARSNTTASLDFCTGGNRPNGVAITPPPNPSGNPPVPGGGGWHCAQVAYATVYNGIVTPIGNTGSTTLVQRGTTVMGAAITGADNHAIQTCFYSAVGNDSGGITENEYGNQAQSYNGSGAVNITPLPLDFPSGTAALLVTYDLTKSGAPGGAGSPEQACPHAHVVYQGGLIKFILDLDPPPANLMDAKFFTVR